MVKASSAAGRWSGADGLPSWRSYSEEAFSGFLTLAAWLRGGDRGELALPVAANRGVL
jgi:hypothetical protein